MIHVSQPQLLGSEKDYVLDCLEKVELSSGAYVDAFESGFASFVGVKHASSCCNGTAALHLALLALGVKPGDDVFVPALSYVATANAVRYCGANPVFVDVDRWTWCMDACDLRRKVEASVNPVGVIAVHLYGVPADMSALQLPGLWLLEDAAEAHGAFYKSKRVGSVGRVGVFSFYGNKILTCGEGGMVVTDDDELNDRVRLFRGQGQGKERFWHEVVGYNYRMTNLQAALGLAQLECYPEHASRRTEVADTYRQVIGHYDQQYTTPSSVRADWLFSLLVPTLVDRDRVIHRMAFDGIETRPVFYPGPMLPPYRGAVPITAAEIGLRGISLPTHGAMTRDDVCRVANSFLTAVGA